LNHYYYNIQGWSDNFIELYRSVVKEAPENSIFVEVGSWKGRSAAYMGVEILNSGKNIKLYCVDHWMGSQEHTDIPTDLFDQFISNVKPISNIVTPIKLESNKSNEYFLDEDCYFVFIDASHDYDNVSKDIKNWFPKVKVGGILAGDDYSMDGVKKAVTEQLPNFESVGTEWPYWRIRK